MKFEPLATKYLGEEANGYECKRAGAKWRAEDEAAEELLRGIPEGVRALDVPVGTGRLIGLMHARNFRSFGVDISPDMLAIADARAAALGANTKLQIGDIREIPFADGSFELVTCLRFLNWIDGAGVEKAVGELARVTRKSLVLGVRYVPLREDLNSGPYPFVRFACWGMGLHRLHAHRTGLHYHPKSFIERLFERASLKVIQRRFIERRIDGTDYVFFLLHKVPSS